MNTLFYYTWKGPKDHLLGCYITYCLQFKPNYSNEDMEFVVPNSKAHLYFPRKDISIYDPFISYQRYTVTTAKEINKNGDYALYKNKERLLKSCCLETKCSNIKLVEDVDSWMNRLSIIISVNKWRFYMDKFTKDYLSYTKFTYEDLERNKWGHKNYLKRVKILPDIYIWDKTINLFVKEKYKPLWYKKEIDLYNKLIGE